MRSRSKPSQVPQAGFGLERIAVTQRVHGCYCASARTGDSGGSANAGSAKRKTPKGGTNRAFAPGRTRDLGRIRENLPKTGDVKNGTAGLRTKGNLRVKRRDPWHRVNVPSKAGADPELSGEDVEEKSQTCLHLVRKPVAQPPVQAS
jgi:hypothetical protein